MRNVGRPCVVHVCLKRTESYCWWWFMVRVLVTLRILMILVCAKDLLEAVAENTDVIQRKEEEIREIEELLRAVTLCCCYLRGSRPNFLASLHLPLARVCSVSRAGPTRTNGQILFHQFILKKKNHHKSRN